MTQPDPDRTGNRSRRPIKLLIGLPAGVVLIVLVLYLADFSWQGVADQIMGARWHILLGVAVSTAVIYYVASLRWRFIVGDLTGGLTNVPVGYFYFYVAVASLSGLLIPRTVGDISVRSLALKFSGGVPLTRGVYSVVVGHLMTFMVNSLFVLPAILFLTKTLSLGQAMVLALVIVALFVTLFLLFNRYLFAAAARVYYSFLNLAARLPVLKKRMGPQAAFVAADFHVTRKTAGKIMLCGLAQYFLVILRLYIVAYALRLDIGFPLLFLGASILLTLSLISVFPASLGLSEAGWYGVLSLAGVADPSAITFIVGERIFSTLAIIVVGGLTWFAYQLFSGPRRTDSTQAPAAVKPDH